MSSVLLWERTFHLLWFLHVDTSWLTACKNLTHDETISFIFSLHYPPPVLCGKLALRSVFLSSIHGKIRMQVTCRQMLRYNAKTYRHSFCRPEKWFSFLQTLTYYTSFYQAQNSEHACIQFINVGLTIVSDLLPETYALTSKCHVPCDAKHHSPVVKRRYFRRAWAKFLAIFDNHSINCIV